MKILIFDQIGEILDLWQKNFDEMCTFWWTKNGIFGGKIWRRSRESSKS